jgi:hypothetical protein
MEKSIYIVYINRQKRIKYVTTQRNTEDMINVIRNKHEFCAPIKIIRICNNVSDIVYKTGDDKHYIKWKTIHSSSFQ